MTRGDGLRQRNQFKNYRSVGKGRPGSGGFLINELVEKISGNDKQVYVKAFQKQNPYEWLDRLKGIICQIKSNKQKGTTLRFTYMSIWYVECQCCPLHLFLNNSLESKHDNGTAVAFNSKGFIRIRFIMRLRYVQFRAMFFCCLIMMTMMMMMMMSLCRFQSLLSVGSGSSFHFVCAL